jgi:hypothetical protein
MADRLSQVIEVIELGRRTGLLSVERTGQSGFEEGDIYFVNGEAIYASAGAQSGRAALDVLRAWGACRFAFFSDIPKPIPNIGPEPRGLRPSQTGPIRSVGPGPRSVAGHWPHSLEALDSSPAPPQRSGSLTGPPPVSRQSGILPSLPGRPFSGPLPYGQEPASGPSGYAVPRAPQPPESAPRASSPLGPSLLALTPSRRPKRAPNPQDIPRLAASYGLSWGHRVILLLADGEHTAVELARLAGRSEEEVFKLLADLVRLGLITLL